MKFLIFLLPLLVAIGDAYKILIFVPTMSDSNCVFSYRVGQLLSEKGGHEVTMYRAASNPEATKGKPTGRMKEIRAKAVEPEDYHNTMKAHGDQAFKSEDVPFGLFFEIGKMAARGCEAQITNKQLMKQLEDEKFDLAITHMYAFCPLGMVRLLKIPSYIWMTSAQLLDFVAYYSGVPTFPSYTPNSMSHKSDRMTFYERAENLAAYLITIPLIEYAIVTPETNVFRKHYGENFPYLSEIARDAPLVFINSEEFLDFPRPILHKVIYTGGIGMQTAEPLDKEWTDIVENPAAQGVVLFSMGTVAKTKDMPESWRVALVNAFKRFPNIRFIVKFDSPFPEAAGVKNVLLKTWVPQKDLLGHPRTKAFITHGGYNSLLESAYCGTPVIAIPLFGDQMTNARRAQRHGVCIALNKLQISEETVYEALKEMLNNKTYYENSQRLSRMLKKKPVKGEELMLRWVDFLAEFQQLPNLQPVGASMGMIEYLSLDVVATTVFGVIFSLWLIKKIISWYYWSCFQTHMRRGKEKLN